MAFALKQHNYEKVPTAEQKKVFIEAWHMSPDDIPPTRIAAHLKIREILSDPAVRVERKRQLNVWREARKEKRARKAAALAAVGATPAR